NGTITVVNSPVWMVATGTGFSGFSSVASDMTDNKEISLQVPESIPVLEIKTKGAYTVAEYSKGVMPSIVFTGGDDVAIVKTWNQDGTLSFSAPVYVDGQIAGTAKFDKAMVGGMMYGDPESGDTGIKLVVSDNYNDPLSLYAGLVGGNRQASSVDVTEGFLSQLGMSDLMDDAKGKLDASYSNWADHQWIQSLTPASAADKFKIEGMRKSATCMGFGLSTTSTVDLTFTDALTKTTNWSVPLKVTVQYN
ncbi:hypothetical protein ACJY9J_004903, partial [Escherichia coli]